MPETPTVTVLGLGALGRAMAVRLDSEGFGVAAWNRSPLRAAATVAERPGITVHERIADAVRGADVVLTVVRDEAAVAAITTDMLPHLAPGAVWVQASTVGPAAARRLAARAAEADVAYLDAPVSGSTAPARAGRLIWLVSGEADAALRARPVLDALGTVKVVGSGGHEASAAKLVVNAWLASAVAAASDAYALADHLGVDHATLRDVLGAGALAMPYALQKMEAMDAEQLEPGFAVNLALKDLRLAASDGSYQSLLFDAVTRRFAAADAAGLGDLDVAALHLLTTQRPDDDSPDGSP